MSPFPSIFVSLAFSLFMESTSCQYVFPFRIVFFYLMTTGWIFDTSLYDNSIDQLKKSSTAINNVVNGTLTKSTTVAYSPILYS